MNPDQLCRLNWYFRGLLVMLVWLFNHEVLAIFDN
jgi:hypothetical protein